MTRATNDAGQTTVNILLVDDHRLFIDGLSRLLETLDRPLKIYKCYTAQQAIDRLDNHHFDLLLVDLLMPGIDGLGLLQAIDKRHVSAPVAIVSSTEDINTISHLMKHGALGFIPKSASSEVMLKAVSTLLQGDIYLPDELWDRLDILDFNSTDDAPVQTDVQSIGDRQLEVLELMVEGKTNKQISTILAISEATVKYHIGILFRKLGVKNRTTCVNAAHSLKLVKSDGFGTHAE